jgi:hypothetical protein
MLGWRQSPPAVRGRSPPPVWNGHSCPLPLTSNFGNDRVPCKQNHAYPRQPSPVTLRLSSVNPCVKAFDFLFAHEDALQVAPATPAPT